MRTHKAVGFASAAALVALLAPASAVAQAAPAPVTQPMDFTPILLGIGALVVLVVVFLLVRTALRRGATPRAEANNPGGRELQNR
jgi:hypothetical protein